LTQASREHDPIKFYSCPKLAFAHNRSLVQVVRRLNWANPTSTLVFSPLGRGDESNDMFEGHWNRPSRFGREVGFIRPHFMAFEDKDCPAGGLTEVWYEKK